MGLEHTDLCLLTGASKLSSINAEQFAHLRAVHHNNNSNKKTFTPTSIAHSKMKFPTYDSTKATVQVFTAIERFLSASQTKQISMLRP